MNDDPQWLRWIPVALLLAACTTVPRQTSQLTAPPIWKQDRSSTAAQDSKALMQWWQLLEDPVLDELMEAARSTSQDLQRAVAKVDESRARRDLSRASLAPQGQGVSSGQTTRSEDRDTGLTTSRESHAQSIDMSWEVDLFGRLRKKVTAANADMAQSMENYHGVQAALAAEVADAYVTLRSTEAQLAVYERNLLAREQTVQITAWREQAGEGSGLETQQATSALDQARATLPSLRQTLEQTRHRLDRLTGRAPGALQSLLAKPRPVPLPRRQIAVGIPAETLSQRPDVRAAARAWEAAVARTQSAERDQLPTLTLTGSLGVEALSAGRLLSPQTALASMAGQLSAPLFNAGRLRHQVWIQSTLEKQALLTWEETVIQALAEVENALIAVQRSAESRRMFDQAVLAARAAEKLAADSFQAGQADLLQVLEAQRTLLNVEEQQVLARGRQASAYIQLYKALGGGWHHG